MGPQGRAKSSYTVASLVAASKQKHGASVPLTVKLLNLEQLKAANPQLVADAKRAAVRKLLEEADTAKTSSDASAAEAARTKAIEEEKRKVAVDAQAWLNE